MTVLANGLRASDAIKRGSRRTSLQNDGSAVIAHRPRDPQHWRDSQQLEHVLGKYIISDKPMSEEEWAREHADMLDSASVEQAVEYGSSRRVLATGVRRTTRPTQTSSWPTNDGTFDGT
jgi:hypothetical protein